MIQTILKPGQKVHKAMPKDSRGKPFILCQPYHHPDHRASDYDWAKVTCRNCIRRKKVGGGDE